MYEYENDRGGIMNWTVETWYWARRVRSLLQKHRHTFVADADEADNNDSSTVYAIKNACIYDGSRYSMRQYNAIMDICSADMKASDKLSMIDKWFADNGFDPYNDESAYLEVFDRFKRYNLFFTEEDHPSVTLDLRNAMDKAWREIVASLNTPYDPDDHVQEWNRRTFVASRAAEIIANLYRLYKPSVVIPNMRGIRFDVFIACVVRILDLAIAGDPDLEFLVKTVNANVVEINYQFDDEDDDRFNRVFGLLEILDQLVVQRGIAPTQKETYDFIKKNKGTYNSIIIGNIFG